MATTVLTASTEAQLNADIKTANAAASGSFVIDVVETITEKSDPTHISLKSGVTLTIDGSQGPGGSSTLDGGGAHRGLFVYSGAVQIENLVIQNASAIGASGLNGDGSGGGGGGGAGLGGGLFVASKGVVTLTNVGFQGDSATGGAGGPGGGPLNFTAGGVGGKGVIGTFGRGGNGAGSSGDGGAGHWGGGGGGAGPGGALGAAGFGAGKGGRGQQIAGGSDGDGGGGGGGLGAGGDIFVQQGGALTIVGGSVGIGTVNGGAGGLTHFGGVAPPGQGLGGGMFLQGNETITLAPTTGTTETIAGVIADQTGSGGTGRNAGLGALVIAGGTVDLAAANTFKGGVTIDSGVLELANAQAGGKGGIDFATGSGELLYAAGASLTNTISGFGGSDAIDFSQLVFATGDHAVDNAGKVAIETSVGQTIGGFDVSGTYTSANFSVGKDTSGDVLVTYAATSTPAAVDQLGGGSLADLLGRYDSQFPMPIPETPGEPVALYSLLHPVLGAETHTGGFSFPGDGNAGGARDALGAGVGSNDRGGHGPGSSG